MPDLPESNQLCEELSSWAAAVLRAAAPGFAASRVTGLAIDCHPWNGHVELSLRTQECPAGLSELGDWDYPELAGSTGTEHRQEAERIGKPLREAWESAGERRAEVAGAAFEACARALSSPAVVEALREYALSPKFQLFAGDPDDPKERNLCSREESRRVRETVGTRAPSVKRQRPKYEIEAREREPGLWDLQINGYALTVNIHTGETTCEGPSPEVCERFRRSLGYYLPPDYPERISRPISVFRNLSSDDRAERKASVDSLVRWLEIPPQRPI